MSMSFQEKSVWIQLIGVLVAFGFYFTCLLTLSLPAIASLGLFIGAVVVLVILQVVFHVLLAVSNPREAQRGGDERDTLIELKASRIGSMILTVGVLTAASLWLLDVTAFFMANAVLFSLVVAQVVENLSQIVFYRRGV